MTDLLEDALLHTPRRFFVGEEHFGKGDEPVPIGHGLTATRPSQVARMLELLGPRKKVLEIGTGCGWQTAVLSYVSEKVYSVEVSKPLYERASKNLKGYDVSLKNDNGLEGWAEHAPYDGIIVCTAVPEINNSLIEQLEIGGVVVAPVGDQKEQMLQRLTRNKDSITVESFEKCGFSTVKTKGD